MKRVVFQAFFLSRVFSFPEPLGAISSSARAGTAVLPGAGGFLYPEDAEEQSAKHVSLSSGCEALPNWGPSLGLEGWLEEAPDLTQTSSCFFCSYSLFANAGCQASGTGKMGPGGLSGIPSSPNCPQTTVPRRCTPRPALPALQQNLLTRTILPGSRDHMALTPPEQPLHKWGN